jgi:hypothetical protein
MIHYIRPTVIRTYSVAELCADAASCLPYEVGISDRNLKRDIEMVEQPLERIRSISTN